MSIQIKNSRAAGHLVNWADGQKFDPGLLKSARQFSDNAQLYGRAKALVDGFEAPALRRQIYGMITSPSPEINDRLDHFVRSVRGLVDNQGEKAIRLGDEVAILTNEGGQIAAGLFGEAQNILSADKVGELILHSGILAVKNGLIQNIIKALNIPVHKDYRDILYGILGEIGDKAAIPPLLERLKFESLNSGGSGISRKALGDIGDLGTISPLLELLKDENEHVRYRAIRVLGMIGDKKVVPVLLEQLKNRRPIILSSLLDALGNIGDRRAVPILLVLLKDEDKSVRFQATRALGIIGDQMAVPDLLKLLDDVNEFVYKGAAEALGMIGSPEISTFLNRMLSDYKITRHLIFGIIGLVEMAKVEKVYHILEDITSGYPLKTWMLESEERLYSSS